jgi:hypothetical protein
MNYCKHCGTPIELVTCEIRPDEEYLWGMWIHSVSAYPNDPSPSGPYADKRYGCHYYKPGQHSQAESSDEVEA